MTRQKYDVVIVGGGHNGFTAGAYLARAGWSVLVLERRERIGGATVTEELFSGIDARVSEYSYLVSLLPNEIIKELKLRFSTIRRSTASFTPLVRGGLHTGFFMSNVDSARTERSFRELTGSGAEFRAYERYRYDWGRFASIIAPTFLRPVPTREKMMRSFKAAGALDVWDAFVETPIGEYFESVFSDDAIRGKFFTDAQIGMVADPHDASLLANIIFLYHVVGNGTGEWKVPVGGTGALLRELAAIVQEHGGEIRTSSPVISLEPDSQKVAVVFNDERTGKEGIVEGHYVLVNAAPHTLAKILPGYDAGQVRDGAAFKINMLLRKLPQFKANIPPEEAWAGTTHFNEGYEHLTHVRNMAQRGMLPEIPAGEVYCHTLTEQSVLGSWARSMGYHTLTLFGLHMPASLFESETAMSQGAQSQFRTRRTTLVKNLYVKAINEYLKEPIEECLAEDLEGNLCIKAKCALDLEDELGMPRGNIFHGDLRFPWRDEANPEDPWGVSTLPTGHSRVLICGAGAERGGNVSGIPGRSAALHLLDKFAV